MSNSPIFKSKEDADTGRKAKTVECDEDTRKQLENLSRGHSTQIRLVRRANIVLGCLGRTPIKDLAGQLDEQQDVIIKWRGRFTAGGIAGLHDAPRSGKPVTYNAAWQQAVLEKLGEKPPYTAHYHVILDSYCAHKRCGAWLAAHPDMTFHYTPTSASWLN